MAQPFPDPESSSLLRHLETLYPLACLLRGPDEADELLIQVYERAAAEPPSPNRPDNLRVWLIGLLFEIGSGPSHSPSDSAVAPEMASDTSDSLRREVARDLVRDALPAALAACSSQERFLLALDAMGEDEGADRDVPTTALPSTSADIQELRSDARVALRTHLQDVLSGPEWTVVEKALPEEALREMIRDALMDRFSHAPDTLRVRIQATLQGARDTHEQSVGEDPPRANESSSFFSRLPWGVGTGLVLSLLALGLVIASLIGISHLSPSTPSPSEAGPGIVDFSAQQAASVSSVYETRRPDDAEAYVESTLNRQVTVPTIEGTRLQGVGQVRVADTAKAPVLLYVDTDDSSRAAIFAYNYALVDQWDGGVTLDPPLREKLARSKRLVGSPDSLQRGLLWRHRDDIFVGVALDGFERLRQRLRP